MGWPLWRGGRRVPPLYQRQFRLEEHNYLYQSPTIYRQGWEHHTIVAFDSEDFRELLGELQSDREIELLSKTSISET